MIVLAFFIRFDQMVSSWTQAGFLAVGTLASEDLTCITAGQLIRHGGVDWFVAIFGCFAGIFLGDLGLFAVGRAFGRAVVRLPWVSRKLPADRFARISAWYEQRSAAAIFAARFLPGTRLPLYLAAGALGKRAPRFVLYSFLAALIWTPILVLLVARFGDLAVAPIKRFIGGGWIALAIAIVVSWMLIKLIALMCSPIGRAKLWARISKIWRWEFWPMWLFYLPILPWIAWLSIRYRGFTTITAANPGIPHGGFVGESKFQILSKLRGPHVIATELIRPLPIPARVERLREAIETNGWSFPLILKPDVGQRGAGVKLVKSFDAAVEYLQKCTGAVIAQPFHPGPYEAGIFYFRYPGEPNGHIFSITDKHFSQLIGDGVSTLEELIWRDPRYRMQAPRFLQRHSAESQHVLLAGERFQLAVAGNHCQGTMFHDGVHLVTPELTAAIDRVAKRFDGFYFGRFDVRYTDVEQFKMGFDFEVIELNGVTSESTNIYDPRLSLRLAYRTLARQWSLLFQIGAANMARGNHRSSARQLASEIAIHYLQTAAALSD